MLLAHEVRDQNYITIKKTAFSLYSTRIQTYVCWGFALGMSPNATILHYLYQLVSI